MKLMKTPQSKLNKMYAELEQLTFLEQEAYREAAILQGQLNPVDAAELEQEAKKFHKAKEVLMKKIAKAEGGKLK